MTEQRDKADDLESRYVEEYAETEQLVEGLDPENTDRDKIDAVEAVGDDRDADHVETMTGNDP